MGQDISTTINPPPLTSTHCIVDGKNHLVWYYVYKRQHAEQNKALAICHMIDQKRKHLNGIPLSNKKSKNHSRPVKYFKSLVRDDDGSLREI